MVNSEFIAAAHCHIVSQRMHGEAVDHLARNFLNSIDFGIEEFYQFASWLFIIPKPNAGLFFRESGEDRPVQANVHRVDLTGMKS